MNLFEFEFCTDIRPGSYASSNFSFLRNIHTISIVATYIASNSVGGFSFLHILLSISYL